MSRVVRDHVRPHLALVTANPVRRGGMQTFTRFLVRTLIEARWRVTIALSGLNIHEEPDVHGPACLAVDPVGWIDATLAGDRAYRAGLVLSRRQWFRRVRPDVALFVQSSNTPFRAAVLGTRLAGVPIVTTHRTLPWPMADVPSRRHLGGLVPGVGLHRLGTVFRTRLTAMLAQRVVYNSEAVRRAYEQDYGYPQGKGCVIPNAVEPSEMVEPPVAVSTTPERHDGRAASRCPTDFRRDSTDRLNARERPFVVGYVGRLGREKRVDLLIDAVAGLRRGRSVEVRIWGDGPERPALEELVRERGLERRVVFHGETVDAAEAYRRSDVFVMCSDREASSNAVLEAMATGLPVVVTRVGGLPELVGHGACGVVVPVGDAGALAAGLRRLVEDDALRLRMGREAQRIVRERHDPGSIGSAWVALLEGMIRGHRVTSVEGPGTPPDADAASARARHRLEVDPAPAQEVSA